MLVCSNYLSGRVPCACPEVDEKAMEDEEEEEGRVSVVATAGKKRARRVGNREKDAVVWYQVEGCRADIRELKGYHRRHRVCLCCANAAWVVVEGENKRYCQQCGRFHILSHFDEGKLSCRRKLEHHNNRRRRKPAGYRVQVEKELPQDVHPVDDGCGGDAGKDNLCKSSPSDKKETLFYPDDGRISAPSSSPESQSVPTESVPSFEASHEAQVHNGKDNSMYSVSPSYCDNRSAYSSLCPTGRISFKLYDWNPTEFPRRLRHQEDRETAKRNNGGAPHEDLISIHKLEATPLLDAESTRNSNLLRMKHCNPVICSLNLRSRPTMYLIATSVVCLGICAVLIPIRSEKSLFPPAGSSLIDHRV